MGSPARENAVFCAVRAAAHYRRRAGAYEPDEARHAMLDRVASEQSAVGEAAPNRPKG
jgi:hypothetical protein